MTHFACSYHVQPDKDDAGHKCGRVAVREARWIDEIGNPSAVWYCLKHWKVAGDYVMRDLDATVIELTEEQC